MVATLPSAPTPTLTITHDSPEWIPLHTHSQLAVRTWTSFLRCLLMRDEFLL
jgi:hypothetical protein